MLLKLFQCSVTLFHQVKFKEWLSPEEYEAVMFTKSIENQHEFLDRSYKELERDYRKVIERLSAAT